MPLTLRRAMPDDYDALHKGEIVGRIYRMIGREELWRLDGTRAAGTDGRAERRYLH